MEVLKERLKSGLAEGFFTHAALAVVRERTVLFEGAVGGSPATLFDVASLTKVFTAALVVDTLDVEKKLDWLDGSPSIADLLAHRSGLPAWRPLFAIAAKELGVSTGEIALDPFLQRKARHIFRRELGRTPADSAKPTYSDLGFLALGFALEDEHKTTLPSLLTRLPLKASRWGGPQSVAPKTGLTRPRDWLPEAIEQQPVTTNDRGVDDDNASALGGACGHAGVWSTAQDVAMLGDALRDSKWASLFTHAGGGRTYGLDTPTGDAPSIGSKLGRGTLGAAGHLGFTGCSLWIDRDASLSIALLTNAVFFERPAVKFREWRRSVHDAVAQVFA